MKIAWPSFRNGIITVFVILWTLLFHYESVRYFYLQPHFKQTLPSPKFLFPPAGWIMFYQVDDQYGFVEVYGVKEGKGQLIDPHDVLRTRTIGFDNIHRNVLSSVINSRYAENFCSFLEMRFPYFEDFVITTVYYPSLVQEPYNRQHAIQYQCSKIK